MDQFISFPWILTAGFVFWELCILARNWHKRRKIKLSLRESICKIVESEFRDSIKKTKNRILPQTFLQRYPDVKRIKNLFNDVSDASNLLIQIGLLGTFLGLTLMILIIQDQTGSDQEIDIISSVASGGISFITSLIGLGSSLFIKRGISKLEQKFKDEQSEIIYRLEEANNELLAAERTDENKFLATEFSKNISDSISDLVLQVCNYSNSINGHIISTKQEFQRLIKAFSDEMTHMLDIRSDIYFSIKTSIENLDKSVVSTGLIVAHHENILETLNENITNFNLNFSNISISLSQVTESIKENISLNTEYMDDHDTVINKIKEILENFVRIETELENTILLMNKNSEESNNKTQSVFELIDTTISKLEKLPEQIGASLRAETQSDLNKSIKDFSASVFKIKHLIENLEQSFKHEISQLTNRFDYVFELETHSELLESFNRNLDQVKNYLSQIVNNDCANNMINSKSVI